MKNYLLASCLLVAAACGTKSDDQAATTDKPATEAPAAEAPAADKPAAEGKELDLKPYGTALMLRVPEGVTAAKSASGKSVELTGPRFMLEVASETVADEAQARAMVKIARDAYAQDKGTVMLVDEPMMAYFERTKQDGSKGYMWFRAVHAPATKKVYMLSENKEAYSDATLTKADHDKMMESARTAKVTGK